jgi:hypothetical protein
MLIGEISSTFGYFPKISIPFTFMLSVSPVEDFSEAAGTDRRMSDQVAASAKLASASPVRLRRLIVQMGDLHFAHAIESHTFSFSSLASIVIPWTVQILDGLAFVETFVRSEPVDQGDEPLLILLHANLKKEHLLHPIDQALRIAAEKALELERAEHGNDDFAHYLVQPVDVRDADLPVALDPPDEPAESELLRLVQDYRDGHRHTDVRRASVRALENGDQHVLAPPVSVLSFSGCTNRSSCGIITFAPTFMKVSRPGPPLSKPSSFPRSTDDGASLWRRRRMILWIGGCSQTWSKNEFPARACPLSRRA